MSGRRADPPYRIETERLVLRCWNPEDAPLLKEAIDSSLESLQRWMPWARDEPNTVEAKLQTLRVFRGHFDLGQEFVYGIFDPRESEVVGGTGLHTRAGESAFEIGYWIRDSRAGNGFATETAAALTRVAFELCEVDRVEIRVELGNDASLAIPRKLGYSEEVTLRRRLTGTDGEPADMTLFTIFAAELAGSPSADAALMAFDALGEPVL
jgi:RimJ/RimL family protein N-acetyltransferase